MESKGFRLCLAGSGGGHVRQLLDLEPVWSAYDYFFVTEESALGESIARDHPARFVDHYSFGQIRLGKPMKALRAIGYDGTVVAEMLPHREGLLEETSAAMDAIFAGAR